MICDDGATGAGNRRCVSKLIDNDKIFALVGNSIYDYAGASYVNDSKVPDVGGQPIGNAYDQYRHLWSIYGNSSPRDGTVGWDGKLYGGTEAYRYFAETLGVKTAGVVAYNRFDPGRVSVEFAACPGWARHRHRSAGPRSQSRAPRLWLGSQIADAIQVTRAGGHWDERDTGIAERVDERARRGVPQPEPASTEPCVRGLGGG